MKLTIRGYEPLVIPDELLKPMAGFGGQTSYIAKIAARWKSQSYLTSKLPSKLLCLESIKERAVVSGYDSYSDPLAGIGMSARIFTGNRRGRGKVYLNDLDAGCAEVLRLNCPKAIITSHDMFSTREFDSVDLLFLDFNDYTMKRGLTTYKPVVEKAARAARKFMVINDCTPFYFRYGELSFLNYSKFLHREIRTIPEYFVAINPLYKKWLPGWSLIYAAYFRDSSFLLLSKTPAKLATIKITGKVPLGMVTVEEPGQLF